ncbi:MAG: hypothetical protein ABI808_07435 [Pseudonocardiales bacterium]
MRRRRLTPGDRPPAVLVGSVSELFQGDLDFGRHVVERLRLEDLGAHVIVEELHYGAVAVMQRLQDLRPAALVLVGAAKRGRAPGTLERRRIHPPLVSTAEVQLAVGDAVTGYVAIDLVVEIAAAFDAFPALTVSIEIEPVFASSREQLSTEASDLLEPAMALIRREAARVPVLALAGEIGTLLAEDRLGPAPAVDIVRALLSELSSLAEDGQWGATFALADRLRQAIVAGQTGDYMGGEDWALWWVLLEELDRLRAAEAIDVAR